MAKSKKQTAAVDLETRRKELGASSDELAAAPGGLTDLDGQKKSGFGTFVEGVVAHPEWSQWPPAKLELSDEEDARIWQKAIARATAPRKIKELQEQNQRQQVEIDQLKKGVRGPVKSAPDGLKGLGPKKNDLSRYLDSAKLTDIQRDCLSMKFEYDLSLAEIARRLHKHHSTVQYHITRATKKIEQACAHESRLKRRSIVGVE